MDIYEYNPTVLVMNRGSTEIAVLGVENWLAMQSKLPKAPADCRKNLVGWSSTVAKEFKPFVIAAGSTVSVNLSFEDKNAAVTKWAQFEDTGGYAHSFFCSELRFEIIGIEAETVHAPLAGTEVARYGDTVFERSWDNFWGKNPYTLVDRWRFY